MFLGLDVHDNVSQMKISLEERVLYKVRNIVTLAKVTPGTF
jgi:hypothetical protein